MMHSSGNVRRMARYKKFRQKSSLNLVSLMDIFTILVFFLLVSSGNAQKLPNSKDIKLPTSIAEKSPKDTLVIAVTRDDILVDGRHIAKINTTLSSENENIIIPSLEKELLFQFSRTQRVRVATFVAGKQIKGKSVTIMGDESIPYKLLRKILATCRQANYTQIAFAAMQKSPDKE